MKPGGWMFGLGVASVVVYVIIARLTGAAGFPLDDAWIHQVYARNLGLHGQWAFILGQPSAGSTSPLWTVLLALGYGLRINFEFWTLFLNAGLLGTLAWLAYRAANSVWAGVLVALEWHLVWAAASGMETVLFCVLIVAALWLAGRESQKLYVYALCGVLTGLAVWTRPDGLTLLPFCAWLVWAGQGGRWQWQWRRLTALVVGAGLIIALYFVFNLALSGQLWPNTFLAKQTEYASLQAIPLWERFGQILAAPLVGVLLLLLPGIGLRAKARWVPLLWVVVFLTSYALRLPVTYQHGRYLIPVIPVFVLVGVEGLAGWVRVSASQLVRRVVSRTWVLGTGAVAVSFWFLGLSALMTDVKIVNSEMVATARWVDANVPPGTLVAAHDIGALGYFAPVRLVDLAGLVSPEVIPLMGDDARLWAFVRQSGARYVITYPGWCPPFVTDPLLTPAFQTGPLCTPDAPNLHMTVYAVQ